jgi:3-oxoacyl-[acyl-carrier protein] reductase
VNPSTTRVVLVTGASGGIGRAVAHRFAESGAKVAVHYHRGREAAEVTLKQLAGDGHLIVQGNVGDAGHVERMMQEVLSQFGRIDVLVNNAGVAIQHQILNVEFAEWQHSWNETVATNLFGAAHLAFFAAKTMVKQGGGRIINISSRGAFRGEPDMPAYGASKAGMNAMSQSLAKALAPHKVYVYAVAPGWVDTERVAPRIKGEGAEALLRDLPMGRVATPEEVAHTVHFLASEGAESLTGAIIDVNGASYLR